MKTPRVQTDGKVFWIINDAGQYWMGPQFDTKQQWEAPKEPGASVPCWYTSSKDAAEAQAALLVVTPRFQRYSFSFDAMHSGRNPKGIVLQAESTGNGGVHQEIRVGAFDATGKCIGDILVGINEGGELRVLVTEGGDGDGDHVIEIFPERRSHVNDFEWSPNYFHPV